MAACLRPAGKHKAHNRNASSPVCWCWRADSTVEAVVRTEIGPGLAMHGEAPRAAGIVHAARCSASQALRQCPREHGRRAIERASSVFSERCRGDRDVVR
eukprot:2681625-Prymnesium_polylepis.1